MRMFFLEWVDYEESHVHLLMHETATNEEFEALCASLIEPAAQRTLTLDLCIGWPEIVEQMVPLLEEHGYTAHEPYTVRIWGPCFITPRDGGVRKGTIELSPETLEAIRKKNAYDMETPVEVAPAEEP